MKAVCEEAVEKYGRLDVMFANAAVVGAHKVFGEIEAEEFMRTMRVNVLRCVYPPIIVSLLLWNLLPSPPSYACICFTNSNDSPASSSPPNTPPPPCALPPPPNPHPPAPSSPPPPLPACAPTPAQPTTPPLKRPSSPSCKHAPSSSPAPISAATPSARVSRRRG